MVNLCDVGVIGILQGQVVIKFAVLTGADKSSSGSPLEKQISRVTTPKRGLRLPSPQQSKFWCNGKHVMTFEELADEMQPLHNDIGIYDCDIVRLVGIGDDGDDYYYIVKDVYGSERWCSAVGAFESLRGKIERYDAINRVFVLNGGTPEAKFRKDVRHLMVERWGIYDTQDNVWLGDETGPKLFDGAEMELKGLPAETLAQIAAQIVDKQLGHQMGRCRAKLFEEKSLHLKDRVHPKMTTLGALQRIEGRDDE